MKPLTDLLYRVPLLERHGPPELKLAQITQDSRAVGANGLFVALPGSQVDGHRFIQQAVKAGAKAIVCERMPDPLQEGVAYLRVKDAANALGHLAANFYGNPSERLQVVGVTGTNGKTTVASLLHGLYTALSYEAGLLGTVAIKYGTQEQAATHTTPDAVALQKTLADMLDHGCSHVFMEVSSHAAHQQRIAGTRFAGALFTNLTHDHLDYHGSFANYRDAKQLFFNGLTPEAVAITNADDKNGLYMLQNTRARRVTYALHSLADYSARILETSYEGQLLNINDFEAYCRLTGRFNAYNLTAVFALAVELGLEPEPVLVALSQLAPVAGRFEVLRFAEQRAGIVDYAHTPDALANVLRTIKEVNATGGRILVVVGAGGDRDATKRPEMARIATDFAQQLILTSDNPRTENPEKILDDMWAGLTPATVRKALRITDRREAIRTAARLSTPGDVVLVAGKGHETYQEINGVRHPFDDREELTAAFQELNLLL